MPLIGCSVLAESAAAEAVGESAAVAVSRLHAVGAPAR
jgi:hypothetical protein